MAGLCTCHNPCRNPLPGCEDGLARGPSRAPTEGIHTLTPSPLVSRAQIPTSAQAPTPPSNKGLFQQFMKIYLQNQNQKQAPPPAPIHAELQESDEEAQRIRAKGLNGYEELDGILYY